MTYTEGIKKSIYKWREANKTEYNKYIASKVNEHYHAHKEEILLKKKNMYAYKKEIQRLSFLGLLE